MDTKEKTVKVKASAASDLGKRFNNEDAYLINENLGLFIVADGMGGHDKGEVASWFSIKTLEEFVRDVENPPKEVTLDPGEINEIAGLDHELLMKFAVMKINKQLCDLNEIQISRCANKLSSYDKETAAFIKRRQRMGTTLVSLWIQKNKAYISHVGDSRAYRIAQGRIQMLTHDHSWVEERVREGLITPEEAKTHKKRNVITRSVGFKDEVEADVDTLTLYPPERFLLCSDGLSNVVEEKDLLELAQMSDLNLACNQMVELAKANRGADNITALLAEVTYEGEKTSDPTQKEFTL